MAEPALLDIPPGIGVISKMSTDDGDFRITWDPDDPEQVENAREAFADLRRHGYGTYKIEPGGKRREEIREFDPARGAMRIIAHRPNQGG